ncbi:hypothetical protein KPNJ1_02299 [Klebsiella pneumoniae 30660/NJST258_1]|uniref:Uncharacterized protein n=1 Tax=Klebsiella pneumoniae 30684/NJST258_2 TaxID=1420013 RepID=W8UIZ8_KLEPN|nr:hypothetical protein KPNJ2_02260 [Klebsiella pneumoniae 30684/NJST258_2]AHM84705.1 hypothetical protein KPNJ1_02299 [Klebsiella pneumoniae 30660/NJST258_1]
MLSQDQPGVGRELSNIYIITDPLSLFMLLFSILNA